MKPASMTAAWAESYGAVGWRVFPAAGKIPAFRGWQDAATTDAALIRRWWPTDPGSNLAAVTGEAFDVFDIERDHVRDFLAAGPTGSGLGMPPISRTGRGGIHLFVRPTGIGHTRKLVLDGTHIGELKSSGGLVLLPPSVTVEQYVWLYAQARLPLPEAPAWMLALVTESAPPPKFDAGRPLSRQELIDALETLCETVAESERGNRNAMIFWAARRAAEQGVPPEAAWPAFYRAAEACGLVRDDGARSVEATLHSALGSLA
jgi:hypothetical protein